MLGFRFAKLQLQRVRAYHRSSFAWRLFPGDFRKCQQLMRTIVRVFRRGKFPREIRSGSTQLSRLLGLIGDAVMIDSFCDGSLVPEHRFKRFQLSESLERLVNASIEPLVKGDFF
jgi:hypothetical protein